MLYYCFVFRWNYICSLMFIQLVWKTDSWMHIFFIYIYILWRASCIVSKYSLQQPANVLHTNFILWLKLRKFICQLITKNLKYLKKTRSFHKILIVFILYTVETKRDTFDCCRTFGICTACSWDIVNGSCYEDIS